MRFAWDDTKSRSNKRKHGISFELAIHAFEDPHLPSWLDKRPLEYEEERWITLGCINELLVIVVVHTFRSDNNEQEITRIISARKATKSEQKTYYEHRRATSGA